jgi:hypothetical protein
MTISLTDPFMNTLLKLATLGQLVMRVANSGASPAFEGTITATLTRGGQNTPLLYTIGTNCSRVEVTATDRPYPVDILDRRSGKLTLLSPRNRSFMRLPSASENQATAQPGSPALPAGVGPQSQASGSTPGAVGPTNLPGMPVTRQMPQMLGGTRPQSALFAAPPGLPAMPLMIPPLMMEEMELLDTGQKTNLLGYACEQYEIKQSGEVMEIWATDQLLPFQPFVPNQPHRLGPRMIEEQWGDLLKARKLFPLFAVLSFKRTLVPAGFKPIPAGPEQLRFEVKSITPGKITDDDGKLFQPPPNYVETRPRPI